MSLERPAPATALMLAAHGERRAGAGNDGVIRLAARLRARGLVSEVGCGFIKGTPTIREAVTALAADTVIVYPLFLSDGYFARVRLPVLLDEAVAGTRPRTLRVLPPLGLDPGFPAVAAERAEAAAWANGLVPSRASLVLLAHGSSTDPASRIATEGLTQAIREQQRFRAVEMALLDEAPSLAQAASHLVGPIVVLGLFAGEGMHGARDAARLVGALDRSDTLFAGTVASLEWVEQLVASAIERLACEERAPCYEAHLT